MIRLMQLSAVLLAFSIPHFSQAQQMYGLFMIVKGDVSFQNPNTPAQKAKVGAKVFEGAVIKSEKDSRAKIVMADRNVFNISPESKMTIQKYDATPGKKTVSLTLEEGKVRVNVEQKYDGNKEKFLLKTPTVVAGVRGTQFLGSYASATKTSQMTSFQGTVAMTSFNAAGQPLGSVRVEKGQASTANFNQAPQAPIFVPKQELRALDKATASTGADANSGSGGTRKIGTGGAADAESAKEIKVAQSDKGGPTAPPLRWDPPTGPVPHVYVPPTLPKNTKVTINVN